MSTSYPLSFTAAGAYRQECSLLARAYQASASWDEVRRQIVDENLLQLNGQSTRRRIASELLRRLRTLEPAELAYLARAFGDDQAALVWLSCCRAYPLFYEFSRELLAARYERMVPDVPHAAYRAFVEEQSLVHPELLAISPKTAQRAEGRVFEIARSCGLLARDGRITPLHPAPELVALIRGAHPEDLELFPQAGGLA